MLTFHAIGRWKPGQLRLSLGERSSRRIVPEVEQLIDQTWARLASRPGVHLFDGPMCRLESVQVSEGLLQLMTSPTSYKPFAGTNLHNPHVAREYGREVLANPLGVSAVLETRDDYVMLGRRNGAVAYYPDRVHPFAGALEPRDGVDAFAAVRRELEEELGLSEQDVSDIECAGLVEDTSLMQPELIFTARAKRSRDQIERCVDQAEHSATFATLGTPAAIQAAIADPAMTPVAIASLLLWGRERFGTDWFEWVRSEIGA